MREELIDICLRELSRGVGKKSSGLELIDSCGQGLSKTEDESDDGRTHDF